MFHNAFTQSSLPCCNTYVLLTKREVKIYSRTPLFRTPKGNGKKVEIHTEDRNHGLACTKPNRGTGTYATRKTVNRLAR